MLTSTQTEQLIETQPLLYVIIDPATDTALHDPTRWSCFMWWVPRLGPTSMIFLVEMINQWASRTSTDTCIMLEPSSFAPMIGVQPNVFRKMLSRLVRFNILTMDDAGFIHLPRFLPELPFSELQRHDEAYISAYRAYAIWCRSN